MKDEHWIDRVSSGSVANVLGSPIASPSVREVIGAAMLSLPPEKLAELMSSVFTDTYKTYPPFGVIPDNGPGSGGFYLLGKLMNRYAIQYAHAHGYSRVVRIDLKADLSSFTAVKTAS